MIPPPDALGRFDHRETRPGTTGSHPRAFARYDPRRRRAYLVQCEACRATATGRLARGVLVSGGFRVEHGRHLGCGGTVAAYDIADTDRPA